MANRWPASADRGTPNSKPWSGAKVAACPREPDHRYGPSGYLQWHDWAEERSKTYRQEMCECGLYLLMVPKKKRAA